MEPGSLVTEDGEIIAPDPAEARLRELYARPESMGIRLSMIQAADRMAVGLDGTARTLNGPEDLRILRVTRSLADVVIVGAQTVRVESYGDIKLGPELLAARQAAGQPGLPDLAIITRNARNLPQGLDPSRTWIFTTEWGRAVNLEGPLATRVLTVGRNEIDFARVAGYMRTAGHRQLLCEGGPAIARLALASHLVDEFCLTTSPRPSSRGPKVPVVPRRMVRTHRLSGAGFVMERWEGPS